MEETKIRHNIKTFIIDIAVIFISLAFIFYSNIKLESKELSLGEMTLDSILAVAVGIAIKTTLGEKGFIKGYETNEYIDTNEKHKISCNNAVPYIEHIDKFEEETIEERKLKYRRTQLQTARLKYDNFFTQSGEIKDVLVLKMSKKKAKTYKPMENEFILDRYQRKTLKKCYRVKIKVLNLFSEYSKDSSNYNDKDTNDSIQRTKMFGKNLTTAIAFSLVGVYFIPVFMEWNWGAFILSCVQVCGFVITGIAQMYSNINFIRVDKVNTLKEKTMRLNSFINNCKKGKYDENLVEKQLITNIG